MIESIQKVIKVGSSAAVTIPAKTMKQQNISVGDEVQVIIQPVKKVTNVADQEVIKTARNILNKYKQDFKNLSER